MFSPKDFIPDSLKSCVVYQFTCASCGVRYIGETNRHFNTHVNEHLFRYKNSHIFKHTLNLAHSSVKLTMETESNGMLPFLGTQLLNPSPRIETKVYVKPTNSGLLLHFQSNVDNRYKNGLLRTMLDRAHRLSSSWSHFSD